jgi:replicative DNA helicase
MTGHNAPVDIFENIDEFAEDLANNPQQEVGMMGPHNKLNDIYGSVLRPGNITVVVARSGQGKTTFALD